MPATVQNNPSGLERNPHQSWQSIRFGGFDQDIAGTSWPKERLGVQHAHVGVMQSQLLKQSTIPAVHMNENLRGAGLAGDDHLDRFRNGVEASVRGNDRRYG